jgi:hypothetical protein
MGVYDICAVSHITARRSMALSNTELVVMTFLDSVEQGQGIPDGCDSASLVEEELIRAEVAGWSLTFKGVVRLKNLRSVDYLPLRDR